MARSCALATRLCKVCLCDDGHVRKVSHRPSRGPSGKFPVPVPCMRRTARVERARNEERHFGLVSYQRQAPILFTRMLATAGIASTYMYFKGIEDPVLGPPGLRLWLTLRGSIGGIGVYFFYCSLHWLQLGDALSIWFTSPLLSERIQSLEEKLPCYRIFNEFRLPSTAAGILSGLFLAEPFTAIQWACALISTGGVVLVAQPTVIFGSASNKSSAHQMLGFLEAGCASVTGAIAFVIIRHIGKRSHPLHLVTYFGWCTAVLMLPVIIFDPSQRADLTSFSGTMVLALIAVRGFPLRGLDYFPWSNSG